jgi:hypothetical protein
MMPFIPEAVTDTSNRMVSVQAEANSTMNSSLSSTQVSLPDAIASYLSALSSGANDSTTSLARLSPQSNMLQMNQNFEQLRNLDMYSRYIPGLTSSSSTASSMGSTSTSQDGDLMTWLLYEEALKNSSRYNTPHFLTQSVPSLMLLQQQLSGPHPMPAIAPLVQQPPPIQNSGLPVPSFLDTAQFAFLQQQQQENQNHILPFISSSNNSNNNDSTDLILLRLAIANGYTSVDQLLLHAAVGRNGNSNDATNYH